MYIHVWVYIGDFGGIDFMARFLVFAREIGHSFNEPINENLRRCTCQLIRRLFYGIYSAYTEYIRIYIILVAMIEVPTGRPILYTPRDEKLSMLAICS